MAYATFPSRCLLGILLLTLALIPIGTSRAIDPPPEPAISPGEAIALAMGQSPLATEGEVGDDDFRISDMGSDQEYDAYDPDVAYNSQDNQYLVVWHGDDGALTMDGEFEIFGQRLDAATGAEIGSHFRISHVGVDGYTTYTARNPAVAYNSTNNQYFVVWEGDHPFSDAFEILGRRYEAATGDAIGDAFYVSSMGADGQQTEWDAVAPAVVYNSTDNRYLVVWHGDDDTFPLDDNEYEIYGQHIDASNGDELGNDIRLSDMGDLGTSIYASGRFPTVAFNGTEHEYLVVWSGCDVNCTLVQKEFEIYGQRLDAENLSELGNNDFRISSMGPLGDHQYDAYSPAVAHNSTDNEYLVVWHGDDNTAPLTNGEQEVFGRRIHGDLVDGDLIGTEHVRVSSMGDDGVTTYYGRYADVVYNPTGNEFVVVWEGYNCKGICSIPIQYEVFGQRLDADVNEIDGDFRLSDMGTHVGPTDIFRALVPAIAYNPSNNEVLSVWEGDDNTDPLVDEEFEIFGQRLEVDTGDEVGDNDFRISRMDPSASEYSKYDAYAAAVAYNSTDDEYLVVWYGDDNMPALVEDEYEIWGQRIDASTGAEVGANDFRISSMGPDGDNGYQARAPDVAHNSSDNEYLVVWYGDDTLGGYPDGEEEIYGQLLDAEGALIGTSGFRISAMGNDLDPEYGTWDPAVAYDSTQNGYLVVWTGTDNTPPIAKDKWIIFGQLLDADGNEIEDDDFRISDMGSLGDETYLAQSPDVAYNPTEGQYLVVWQGNDDNPSLASKEQEIYGQRIEAATGNEIGTDFRISSMGPDKDDDFGAGRPALAYNSIDNEYLVVWGGDDNTGLLMDEDAEIFGQLLNKDGDEIGTDDFRISDMGPEGKNIYAAYGAAVTFNHSRKEYMVVWAGSEIFEVIEIYGQRLMADGRESGRNDMCLSDMGPEENPLYGASFPAVASTIIGNEVLIVWTGDDDRDGLHIGEKEAFGQRFEIPSDHFVFLPMILRE